MQYTNKLNGKEGEEVHSNIYDSNDFDRIVGEINQNQNQNKNQEKKEKGTYMVRSINVKKEFVKSSKEDKEEGTPHLDKQKNHQKMLNRNHKNEKRKSMSIDEISIFPHATSLVLTAESKETYIPSNSIKNTKLTKTKKSNSLKKFDDSYNIDTYEKITSSLINKTERKQEKSKRKVEKETHKNNNRENVLERKGNQNTEGSYINHSYKSGNPFDDEEEDLENEKHNKNETENKQMNLNDNDYNYEQSSYDNDSEPNEKGNENGYKRNNKEDRKQKDKSEFNKSNEHTENSDYSNVNSSTIQRKQNKNTAKNSNATTEKKSNTENEKEENYLKSPFVLSIESLDETEKEYEETKNKNANQLKNKTKEPKELKDQHQENDNSESEENKDSIITESYEPAQATSNSIITDNQYSLQKKSSSRKSKRSRKGKESIEQNLKNHDTKSNATTTDSDYSFNEQMNISYENFKLYNKNKMYYIINQEKKKNELLEALNTEQTLKLRRILRIMREFYIGFIGIQLIYFITTVLMGMSNIYLVQIFSLSCTIFSILDANYHGYLLNGFINFIISILFTLACAQAITGFEDLETNSTLKNIAISNVVLLFLFSILSFVNGFYIYKLHSTEKKCIKKVINTIEESTTT